MQEADVPQNISTETENIKIETAHSSDTNQVYGTDENTENDFLDLEELEEQEVQMEKESNTRVVKMEPRVRPISTPCNYIILS